MGQLGDPAPVYVHHVDVSVTAECDLSAIRRPGPRETVVGEHLLTASVHVNDDDCRAVATYPTERELLAVGRPDGIELGNRVVREVGNAAPVGVHDVDIEVAVAVAVEGDPSREALTRGGAEPRTADLGSEGLLGVVTRCDKNANGENGKEP